MTDIKEKFLLASGYYQQGDLRQAENICRSILKEQPDNFHVLYFAGMIYYRLGEYDSSIKYIKKATGLNPNHAEAYYNLGNAFRQKGQFDEAISCYLEAFKLNPAFYEAYNNLGIVFQSRNQPDEAIIYYRKALELNPRLADAYYNLGTIFQDKEQFDEAIVNYKKALQIDQNFTDVYYNLGNIYRETGSLDEALSCFQKALRFNPGLDDAYHNIGTVLMQKGMYDEALSYFRKALQLNPNLVDARWSISLIHLACGNFSQGWREYESRWHLKDTPRRNFYQPPWDGSSLKGKNLLVYDEQGVGDEIMFASCLPQIIAEAALCIIETDKRLVPVFARSFPKAKVIERITEDAAYPPELQNLDMRVPIGSLPKFLRPNLASFPVQKAYLIPDALKTEVWQNRFASLGKGFRVGISWRGGGSKDVRLARSTVLAQWEKLFSIPGIHFVNLQYVDCKKELEEARQKVGVSIHDWEDADPLKDLDNFASEIAALDLVVSVDNATVHMAGALGVPVWTLLPFACDWRWMQKFEDTPWYPSMRLFRQNTYGDWNDVFERVYKALKAAVQNGHVVTSLWKSSLKDSYESLLHDESSRFHEKTSLGSQTEGDRTENGEIPGGMGSR
jgi:tetratricopeptide (TPR) repeat protein